MYPLSSMITPEPEPDCACEGVAGTPRVRIVTTEGRTFATTAGTGRDLSCNGEGGTPAFARARGPSSDATNRSSNHRREKRKIERHACPSYGLRIRPRVVESGLLSHKFWFGERQDDRKRRRQDALATAAV